MKQKRRSVETAATVKEPAAVKKKDLAGDLWKNKERKQ